jgi:hypothetical protein
LLAGRLVTDAAPAGRGRWLYWLPLWVALGQQTAGMIHVQNVYKKPWGYLAGRCDQDDYLDNVLTPDSPAWAVAFANVNLPENAKILTENLFRTFYLDRDFRANSPWDHDYLQAYIRESASPQELLRRLRADGFTHLLINQKAAQMMSGWRSAEDWTEEDKRKAAAFIPAVATTLYNDGYWLGELRAAPVAVSRRVAFVFP